MRAGLRPPATLWPCASATGPSRRTPPRKTLARAAPRRLSDAELLAMFLGSGLRGHDAVDTARDLLNAHGPLRALLDRPRA